LQNYFLACFYNIETSEQISFEISQYHNDTLKLKEFLSKVKGLIGFNNISYDSQVLQLVIDSYPSNKDLYELSQKVILSDKPVYPIWKITIPQLDIFKINHWDNKAKSSSLKWLEFSIDYHNVEDMPIHYTQLVKKEERDMIKNYCWNDVMATYELYLLCQEQIKVREELSKTFSLNLYNASETKISKQILSKKLSEKMGISVGELLEMKTYRSEVSIKDVLLHDKIIFQTDNFKNIYEKYKNTVVNIETENKDEKKKLKYSTIYNGIKLDYGLGGIHGCIKPGVYTSDDKYIIKSADVTSFYPFLAIKYKFKPDHLPDSFFELYEWYFTERKKYDKKHPLNYVYKIILNGTYGLSKDANSFLYDPKMTFSITVNGQLLLSMLIEQICEQIPEAQLIMANTDGFEVKIPRSHIEKYNELCDKWCKYTELMLEFVDYEKMIIVDVNNYMAVSTNNEIKHKGLFEYKDLKNKKVSVLHKNKSMLIIPIALEKYFIDGIKIEDTIGNHTCLEDFFIGMRCKGDAKFQKYYIENGSLKTEPLQKTIRYVISNKGVVIKKIYDDGRSSFLNVHPQKGRTYYQTLCNDLNTTDNLLEQINKSFYIKETRKIIHAIETNTLTSNFLEELYNIVD